MATSSGPLPGLACGQSRSRPWWPAHALARTGGVGRCGQSRGCASVASSGATPYSPLARSSQPPGRPPGVRDEQRDGAQSEGATTDDEEDLDELTALCLNAATSDEATSEAEADDAASQAAQQQQQQQQEDAANNHLIAPGLKHAAKQEAPDGSGNLAGLLAILGSGAGAREAWPAGAAAVSSQVVNSAPMGAVAYALGAPGAGITGAQALRTRCTLAAPDSGVDTDIPLVSSRAHPALDTPARMLVPAPRADAAPSSVGTAACSGVSGSTVGGAGAGAGGAAGDGGGALVCGSVGGGSPRAGAVFAPHPAWAAEAGCLLYVGVFLTPASREVLLSLVPPAHALVCGDHMTLAFKPSVPQALEFPLGAEVELRAVGAAADGRAQAVLVEPPAWLPPTTGVATHITISVALGARPAEAGHLIRDAVQAAALGGGGGGAGDYQHWPEPLPLVGRLGLKLLAPPGSPGGWDCVTAGAGSGGSGGWREIVVFSIEELARSGAVSIGSDTLELFFARHAGVLGRAQQAPTCFSVSPTSLPASPALAPYAPRSFSPAASPLALSAPAAANAWSAVEAAMAQAAAAAAPRTAAAPAGSAAAQDDELLQLCSPPAQLAAGARSAAPPLGTAPLAAAGSVDAACLLQPDSPTGSAAGGGGGSDSSSSSGGSEAVQFVSDVAVGDRVLLRPFVPTEGGERLLQGYVREYACDEAFQPSGVLVVLEDNTIGFVAAVLDHGCDGGSDGGAAGQRSSGSKRPASGGVAAGAGGRAAKAVKAAPHADGDALTEVALAGRDGSGAGGAPHGGRRNARAAERDLQLWRDFEALSKQHGEELCNAILSDCGMDFDEAIGVIRRQHSADGVSAGAAAAPAAAAASPAAPAAAPAGIDEDLLQQLALSLGLAPDAALQLARLVPQLPVEGVVEALQQHGGDVAAAADALLGTSEAAAVAAAADAAEAQASPTSSHASSPGAASGCSLKALAARDPALAVGAQQLCSLVPGLHLELASMLLQEHGNSVEEAARALADMQAHELQARLAAAAGSTPSGRPTAAAFAGSSSGLLHGAELMSEADQLAILTAMGELHLEPQPAPVHAAPRQAPVQAGVQAAAQPPASPPRPLSGARRGGRCQVPPPPPPQADARYYQPQPQPPGRSRAAVPAPPGGAAFAAPSTLPELEAKRAAKAEADALYAKSRTLGAAAEVFLTAAQACLADGDMAGFRDKKARADAARAESRAACEAAQRVAWSANNTRSNCWEVDLHGLHVAKALGAFARQFEALRLMDHPGGVLFRVIVGQGHHSEGNVPRIKNGVLQYLQEQAAAAAASAAAGPSGGGGAPWGVTWEVDPANPGVINVHIPCSDDDDGAGSEPGEPRRP